MAKKDELIMTCVHGLQRQHVVSGGGSMCGGPFRWEMTRAEAAGLSEYYLEYEQFYNRTTS